MSVSGSTPSLSDLSLLAGRPRSGAEGGAPGGILGGTPTPGVTGSAAELHAAAAAAYSRLASPYMDPLYTGLHSSPTASLRLSPIDSRGTYQCKVINNKIHYIKILTTCFTYCFYQMHIAVTLTFHFFIIYHFFANKNEKV